MNIITILSPWLYRGFMVIMALISLTILFTNITGNPDSTFGPVQRLFLVWGVMMAAGSIMALAGDRLGLVLFAAGAFAECIMILWQYLANGLAPNGMIVGIMPIIAYLLYRQATFVRKRFLEI